MFTITIKLATGHRRTSTDSLSFVEKVENVSAPLMVQPENGPQRFHFPLAFVWFSLGYDGSQEHDI